MSFTYSMLQMPPFVLLTCMVLALTLFAVTGTYFFRKYVVIKPLRAHNEIVGYIFAVLGGFYGLLLGFVVFLVWDSMNDAQANANREGSVACSLYRDIIYYPDSSAMAPLKASYLRYVHGVVEKEFPAMEEMKPLGTDHRVAFSNVFRSMSKVCTNDNYTGQMFRQLNELAVYRNLRMLDAGSSIPIEIWVPLLLGSLIILLFAMMPDVESLRLHMAVNGLLGAFIALVMYIIVLMDHPFTGRVKIQPEEYNIILNMERENRR